MIWHPFFYPTRNLRLLYCWKLSWEFEKYEEFQDGEFEIGDMKYEFVRWDSNLGDFSVSIDYFTGLRYHVSLREGDEWWKYVGSFWTLRGLMKWLRNAHAEHKMRVIHNE